MYGKLYYTYRTQQLTFLTFHWPCDQNSCKLKVIYTTKRDQGVNTKFFYFEFDHPFSVLLFHRLLTTI